MKIVCVAAVLAIFLVACNSENRPTEQMTDAEVLDSHETEQIDLQGKWHFKVYRKYDNMFQYFNYGEVGVAWEDADIAGVPNGATFSLWESVIVPSPDYSTGGLQQMSRKESTETKDDRTRLTELDLFPKWSEAWFSRTFEVPENFLAEDTVTLLLGIIDDLDVVYINGTPIGAKGFITSDGTVAPPGNVPDLGGFSPKGDFRFEKSYWEVPREYVIDANLLHVGTNELSVRVYNNNSFGGFYDRTIALVATDARLRELKGLPTEQISNSTAYAAIVAAQQAAIESENLEAYAATLSNSYIENELDKMEQVAALQAMFGEYENIRVTDTNSGYYWYSNAPVYSASRLITGEKDGETVSILSEQNHLQYFIDENDSVVERGNLSHSYQVRYVSSLERMQGATLAYSIYLPPSYYSKPTRSYPIVYLLHGINSTGESFVNVDRIEQRMNEWIDDGSVAEMIVVMPNSGKGSGYADSEAPNGPTDTQGPWESHIYIDIRNEIETNYRTISDARFRGLTGISMGGGGVFKIGLMHPDIYTSFAAHMGAVPDIRKYTDRLTADILPTLDFYIDHGKQDQMAKPENSVRAAEYLRSIEANVEFELRDGGHNSAFYMEGMPRSMAMHSRHFLKNGLESR